MKKAHVEALNFLPAFFDAVNFKRPFTNPLERLLWSEYENDLGDSKTVASENLHLNDEIIEIIEFFSSKEFEPKLNQLAKLIKKISKISPKY